MTQNLFDKHEQFIFDVLFTYNVFIKNDFSSQNKPQFSINL